MAKRAATHVFQIKDEAVYGGDPLENYCNESSFNILQFIAEGDTPVDSPQTGRLNNPQDPHHANGVMFNPARLPDSPPITEVSGAGSSASPHSSNSESPYSPPDYSFVAAHNGNGLILTANELQSTFSNDILQQQVSGMNRLIHPQSLASPQSVSSYLSYHPQPTPASTTQVSPQPNNRNGNYYDNANGMYQSNSGSDNSINSAGVSAKKRPRVMPMATLPPGQTLQQMLQSPMGNEFDEPFYQHTEMIRFNRFQEETWQPLFDINHQQLSQMTTQVVADKGFNFSPIDNCFVNQKKNHFQITLTIETGDTLPARFVRINNEMRPIKEFQVAFTGVKNEMLSSEIQIKQSQTDRKPQAHTPVKFQIAERQSTKVTVPRLHFSETTMSNQRKGGKPNPDQRYFLLIVRLFAVTEDDIPVCFQSFHSEKVIVRATNPGQFEQPDADMSFQKNGDIMSYPGRLVVGGEKPFDKCQDSVLHIHGNAIISGNFVRPSDERLKENIVPLDQNTAVDRFKQYELVTYDYKPEVAASWNLDEHSKSRAGMIAQQLKEVYPEAVVNNGDYLTIDENRLFYDHMAVTKELMQLTQELDKKIVDNVEELQRRIQFLMRKKQLLGSIASGLSDATSGFADNKSYISTSEAPMDDKKSRKRRKSCHTTTCNRSEPMCSSRFTQGTIVGLVIVMAACLLAMSALYILDWHNRNNNFNSVYSLPSHQAANPKEEIGTMTKTNNWVPESQPGITPLMATCRQTTCKKYCCQDTPTGFEFDKPSSDEAEAHLASHQQIFEKRSVPSQMNTDSTTIEILNMNITVNEAYCHKSCSKKRGRYNFYIPISTYMPTIPLLIRINAPRGRIINNCGFLAEFKNSACDLGIHQNSGVSIDDVSPVPYVTSVSDDVFEVSAGAFRQSAYRFRIGYTTDACYTSGVFDEYNLVFYRTCNSEPTRATTVSRS